MNIFVEDNNTLITRIRMMMKAIYILLITILGYSNTYAQAPKKFDFASPLDIPLILSGTFGELRSNHFHTGIDIKTQGREGLKVKSIANGYISRINISPSGYGKAIYIVHPNGYTSVYAHLKVFAPAIEKFVKEKQYEKQKYNISIFPNKEEIKVSKNEVIAKSGNSGGSAGPHLHFEIRDTKSQKPQNPFNFDYKISDTRKPTINNAFIYNFDDVSGNKTSSEKINLVYNKETKEINGDNISTPEGWIAFGIDSYDKLNNANNKNGIYSVKLSVNNKTHFEYKMNTLDFSEQRYINSFIDYEYYKENKKRIQKLFLDPGNKLSLYDFNINNGYLFVEQNKAYSIKIEVEDYKGNKSIVNFNLNGTNPKTIQKNRNKVVLDYTKDNIFETEEFRIKVPKGALYNHADFNYSYNNNIHNIGSPNIPLQKSCSIELKIDKQNNTLSDKMIISLLTDDGDEIYAGGKIDGDYIKTRTRSFGNYKISYDTISPKIKPINIYEGKWMSKERFLKIKISDNLTGIKSFNGYIDGKWILLEYDAKNDLLKFDFSDIDLIGKKHTFTLNVIDYVGNESNYEVLFYRKI